MMTMMAMPMIDGAADDGDNDDGDGGEGSSGNGNWTWLRSAWEVLTMLTDKKFLEIELHAEADRSRKPHEGARHGGETIPESVLTANALREFVTESPTMEQTMPKLPTMDNIVTDSPWRKVP